MTVYVLNPSIRPKNLEAIEEWGEIRYIFDNPRHQFWPNPQRYHNWMLTELQDFDPEEDYVLFLGGDFIGAIMLGRALGDLFPYEDIETLRWDRAPGRDPREGEYIPVTMPAFHEPEGL
jgi:hypothetical protein